MRAAGLSFDRGFAKNMGNKAATACVSAWTCIREVVNVGTKVIVEAQKLMQTMQISPTEVGEAIEEQKHKPVKDVKLIKYGVKDASGARMLQVLQNFHDSKNTGQDTKEQLNTMMQKFKTSTESGGEFFENTNCEGFALCKWAAQKDDAGNLKKPARYDMIFISCFSRGIQLTNSQIMAQLIMEGVVGKRTRNGEEVLYFQVDVGSSESEGAF